MVLSNKGNRHQIVNLLSEFILSKIPSEHKTMIEIVDCVNFFVIKGYTSHESILNMFEVIEEFKSKNSDIVPNTKSIKTIDLIEYSSKIEITKSILLKFYNTEFPRYSKDQISHFNKKNVSVEYDKYPIEVDENSNFIQSTFPYGYSFKCGKSIYQYLKRESYKLMSDRNINEVFFLIENICNPTSYTIIYENTTEVIELSSEIIDKIINDIKNKVDLSFEIINPLSNNTEI